MLFKPQAIGYEIAVQLFTLFWCEFCQGHDRTLQAPADAVKLTTGGVGKAHATPRSSRERPTLVEPLQTAMVSADLIPDGTQVL